MGCCESSGASAGATFDRQTLDARDEVRCAPRRRRRAGQLQGRHALQQLVEEHAQLEARQIGTEAEMRADAEGDMVVRRARGVEPVRVRKYGVVTVGSRVQEQQLLAGFDALAVQLDA